MIFHRTLKTQFKPYICGDIIYYSRSWNHGRWPLGLVKRLDLRLLDEFYLKGFARAYAGKGSRACLQFAAIPDQFIAYVVRKRTSVRKSLEKKLIRNTISSPKTAAINNTTSVRLKYT